MSVETVQACASEREQASEQERAHAGRRERASERQLDKGTGEGKRGRKRDVMMYT